MGKIAGNTGIGRSNDAAEIKGDELGGVVRGWKIGDFEADDCDLRDGDFLDCADWVT